MFQREELGKALRLTCEIAKDLGEVEASGILGGATYEYREESRAHKSVPTLSLRMEKRAEAALQGKIEHLVKEHVNPVLRVLNRWSGQRGQAIEAVSFPVDGEEGGVFTYNAGQEIPTLDELEDSRMHSREEKVFISHSARDKEFAGRLARYLRILGHEPFVAHDDIQGGDTWTTAILVELQEMQAFVACVTENFNQSVYCHQETGYAVSRTGDGSRVLGRQGIKIIPLKLGAVNPLAMIADRQATPIPDGKLGGAQVAEIARLLSDNAWR